MELQNAYRKQMSAQLKEWSAQINLLEAQVATAGAEMQVKRAAALNTLRAQQHAASEKMRELGSANDKAWDQVKLTADKVWQDLKDGIANTQAIFK